MGYTATQYALLSSTYAWLGKILKGFSGAEVESLSTTHGLIHGYGIFFIACGLPACLPSFCLRHWITGTDESNRPQLLPKSRHFEFNARDHRHFDHGYALTKAAKYGELNRPLVVAVNVLDDFCEDCEVCNALLGEEGVVALLQ